MHIKKLEISGFKSFVDRTVIQFDHDVIGIVGPNGCGKSNIVDAIRWCMGEQSAKHLRGRAMEDVIFNGSDTRGPHGLAEVTITFDNTDPQDAAELPAEVRDYPEIAVTRRLYRDGTSEYLINKTQVRLRDVTELFLGTGVGTKAYSIVEQGRIGQIVSARPEDRRLFLEEAAGITKYKTRRKQAERKMELTRQNLLRVSDIVSEIDKNRAALKRQVAKAQRFLEYRGELEDLVLHRASHRLLEILVVGRVERQSREAAEAESGRLRCEVEAREAQLEAARGEARALEDAADAASRAAFDADNRVTSLGAEIGRARDRLTDLGQRLTLGALEKESLDRRAAGLRGEAIEIADRLATLEADETSRAADAASEDEALATLRGGLAEADVTTSRLRAEAGEAARAEAAATARLEAARARLADLERRRERLCSERDALQAESMVLGAKEAALVETAAAAAEGKRVTEEERQALEHELAALRPRLLESEKATDAAKSELSLARSRLRALEELHRRLEGVGAGARALLERKHPAVLGLVADRLEAPPEVTAALAGLLGRQLESVVVADPRAGLELLDELARQSRGRATVVPLRPRRVVGPAKRPPEGEGVLGLLMDRLDHAPEDDALVRSLVGDAVLVDTAARAAAMAASGPAGTYVALDGTVATSDGALRGGSGDDVAAGMVEQKREIRALTHEVERLGQALEAASRDHAELRARITAAGAALDRAREGAHARALAHVTAEKDLANTRHGLERVAARTAALAGELGDVERALVDSTEAASAERRGLDDHHAHLERAREALGESERASTEWRARVEAQAATVTERKVRLAQVREQVGSTRRALERLGETLAEVEHRLERLDAERTEAAISYGENAALALLAREARVEAEAIASAAHGALNDARALLEQARHAMAAYEGELREQREGLSASDEQLRRAEMAQQRLALEEEHLVADVRARFRGLELKRVIGDYHARPAPDSELERRVSELTQLIDRIGPVNLDAQAEFEDAERRFTELNDQKVDIERALDDLDRAIKHMDRESRKRFRETFQSVNELFKATFSRMFRGGRAELRLTNPDDLLTTGVDVIAQPPGKNLASIELMSGGEKALTAVSLIFAIFQHRPSPFCVLDEVDAPLDEANVARYNEAIRAMTDRSQFILITHIRKTMQSVDVLYGVTMGEPGVSRIVSVKVNDAASTRSERALPSRELDSAGAAQQVA
ncbi:MAG: chromosome segregation protein SMC [Polyangiaceae bacterium]|nr:chromosome segregation protein SMC [Polyangiaceae bacterium]